MNFYKIETTNWYGIAIYQIMIDDRPPPKDLDKATY